MIEYLFEILDANGVDFNPMETRAALKARKVHDEIVTIARKEPTEYQKEIDEATSRLIKQYKRAGFYSGFKMALGMAREMVKQPEITSSSIKAAGLETDIADYYSEKIEKHKQNG